MPKRVCITAIEIGAPGQEVVVVALPWSNSPRDLNPEMSQAVANAVGGLPVVLLAVSPQGLHSFGSVEHTAVAIKLDFHSVTWQVIDVDGPDLVRSHRAA